MKRSIYGLLIGILIFLYFYFVPPIPQDEAYHLFFDTQCWAGVPNMLNVISNLGFLIFGSWGLLQLRSVKLTSMVKWATGIFFVGIFATGVGSSYYHWHPNNATLLWDRLPMTVAFMSFFFLLCHRYLYPRFSFSTLTIFLGIGISSVWYWYVTEQQGRGDLRAYVLVQFVPVLFLPYIIIRYRKHPVSVRWIAYVAIAYVAAKLMEGLDKGIGELVGMGGHPVKHVFASFTAYFIGKWIMLPTSESRDREES